MEEEANIPSIQTQYPPGIRFRPSDEELISYYLKRKVKSLPLPANVITDIELYSYNPWELPKKTLFGEDEWYFFTPRDRKYPKGWRPNRTTASGYWKATGTDKPILSSCGSKKIGVKKALVFYQGRPPSGHKMDWAMTEYRLPDASRSRGSMRLDDWVLCRIRQKGNMSKNEYEDNNSCKLHEPNIKNLPLKDSRDMLADYFQPSEHQKRSVSLLVGDDPVSERIPCAPKCMFSDSIETTKMTTNEPKYGPHLPGEMVATMDMRSFYHLPNYPSNAYINYLLELDIPALQEDLFSII